MSHGISRESAAADASRAPAEAGLPLLEAGRRALSEGRFDEARRRLEAALDEEETPEAHEGLGWAAIWRDEVDRALGCFEDAHRLYLERDDRRDAGRVALWLAYTHGYIRGQPAIAGGWGERATRLLEGLPPGPEHVWLAIATAAARGGDAEQQRRLACEAAEIARGLARPDLEAMGLASEGLCLVAEGKVGEGMRLLDEAAAAAIASHSDDFAAVGHACCAMLAACELAGDLERASEWCERTTEYASRYGFRPLHATCRTSYAGVLIWCGRWEEAEAELLRADSEFAVVRPAARGQAIARLADLRRRQGRFAEASELFAQVEGSRPALLGFGALALARGEAERARDLAERYLRQLAASDRAARAAGLGLLVRASVACCELDKLEDALGELRSIAAVAPTEPLQALAASAAGTIASARGDPDGARQQFEDAVDLFSRCSAPFEAARARLDLARALRDCGRPAAAAEEAQAAGEAFGRLGAAGDLELTARFLAALDDTQAEGVAVAQTTELTARELEVLALIAAGLSSREVAARLVISEHTVHRHVTNLYGKLGVSSRAAAVAHALRHRLV